MNCILGSNFCYYNDNKVFVKFKLVVMDKNSYCRFVIVLFFCDVVCVFLGFFDFMLNLEIIFCFFFYDFVIVY